MTSAESFVLILLCACAGALTLAGCRWLVRQRDTTGSLSPPLVPLQPDPYELAYLRGGARELVRLLVFSLTERRFLKVIEGKNRGKERLIHQMRPAPPHHELSDLERGVVQWFSDPRTPDEIFKRNGLSTEVEEHCGLYRERLAQEQLLTPPAIRRTSWLIGLAGAFLLAGLTLLALTAVASVGGSRWNSLICIVATVSLVVLINMCTPPRASRRGQALVERLRLAYGHHKQNLVHGGGTHAATLAVSLFGIGVLAGTPHNAYAELFKKSSSGGGCGGCGGCGSCGGSCGGCGGCD